jgi:hypothetical protein
VLSRAVIALTLGACGGAPPPGDAAASSACPTGDVVVQVEAEAAALAGCAAMRGDLTVGPSFTLASATGLGDVRHVRGALDVSDNLSLGGVYLGGLISVDGDVVIENNRALSTASLHRLTEVGGDLIVRGNRALERLDLAALRRVGGRVQISGQPALEAVELGALRSAGSIEIEDVPAWPTEEIDAVKRRVVPPDPAPQPP